MRNTKRKPKVWSTHYWVVLYTIFYMVLTIFYCLPRLLVQLIDYFGVEAAWLSATATSGIPLEIFAWGLLALCAGYAGVDRAALATKSSLMEIGSCDMGDPAKLRRVIYLLMAVFIESVVLNLCFGEDFTKTITSSTGEAIKVYPGLKLPLEGVSSALVSTMVIYVLGNKSIRLTQSMDRTKKDEDWANERKEHTLVRDPKLAAARAKETQQQKNPSPEK